MCPPIINMMVVKRELVVAKCLSSGARRTYHALSTQGKFGPHPLTSHERQPSPEKAWPCPRSHSSPLLSDTAGLVPPQGGSLGAASIVCSASRKPLCSATWAAERRNEFGYVTGRPWGPSQACAWKTTCWSGFGWRPPCLEKGVAEGGLSPDEAGRLRACSLPLRGWLEGLLYA